MAFDKIHSNEVRDALVAYMCDVDGGHTAKEAWGAAATGQLDMVPVEQTPPLATISHWKTVEHRRRLDAMTAAAPETQADALDVVAAQMGQQLARQAAQLARRRGGGKPEEWARLAKAGEAAARFRRALRGPEPKASHGTAVDPAKPEPPAGFLEQLEAEA